MILSLLLMIAQDNASFQPENKTGSPTGLPVLLFDDAVCPARIQVASMLRKQFVRICQQFPKKSRFFRIEGHPSRHLQVIFIPLPNVEFCRPVIPTDQIDLLFPALPSFSQYAKMAHDREMELPVVFHSGRFPSLRLTPHLYTPQKNVTQDPKSTPSHERSGPVSPRFPHS